MIKITYSPDGKSNGDSKSEKLAMSIYKNKTNYTTSTDSLITAFRMHVAEGKIPCDEIAFIYNGQKLTLNECGEVSDYPDGFCYTETQLLRRFLKARASKRKKLKK